MTYFRFHCIFNLPLLLLLGYFAWPLALRSATTTGIVLAIVIVFTSVWDNYAVKRNIWNFPKDKYLFRISYLPVEEYAFFIIQSLEVILLIALLIQYFPFIGITNWSTTTGSILISSISTTMYIMSWLLMMSWFLILPSWILIGFIVQRKIQKSDRRWHYTWHLLYWFMPILLGQWVIAWPILLPRLSHLFIPTLITGTYLCIADWIAVRQNIWFFDPAQITGFKIAKILPWEEVAFFYITSLLVAQSYIILLPDSLR